MRKTIHRIALTIILLCVAGGVSSSSAAPPERPIVKVVKKAGSYSIIGERGRKLGTVLVSGKDEMIGYNSKFCLFRSGDKYSLYNSSGRKYMDIDTATIVGTVKAVSGYTFSSGNDSVTVTYGPKAEILSIRHHPIAQSDSLISEVDNNSEIME